MPLSQQQGSSSHTPEGMFAAKYAWLMRWAMHFAQNDREAAEDLVQDTFVRLLLSWNKLHSLQDIEPLLYSYLRYAHLTERRKGRGKIHQALSAVDSDSLATSLRVPAFNQIEVQNELRTVLTYLLWRRATAKFAGMFLLRFFHGYFPEEIALICVTTRHSVDLSLSRARTELKAHLNDPQHVPISGMRPLVDRPSPGSALPVHEFIAELRRNIFESHLEVCPPDREFERQYNSLVPRSLDNNLFAHIVICEPCLEKATARCGAPPPSGRSMEDSIDMVGRGRDSNRFNSSERADAGRMIREGNRRTREIAEQHPSELIVAINGQMVAATQVSGGRSVLKVEIGTLDALSLVEVYNERGLLLLGLPVLQNPPLDSPELMSETAMSGGRSLTLLISFGCESISIEAIYREPSVASDVKRAAAPIVVLPTSGAQEQRRNRTQGFWPFRTPELSRWCSGLLNQSRTWFAPSWPALSALATLLVVVCSVGLMQFRDIENRERFTRSLEKSVAEESKMPANIGAGVVHQRIRIQSTTGSVARDLYHDVAGRRTPKRRALSDDEQFLAQQLAKAGLDWNNPLSSANFKLWHDRADHPHDSAAQIAGGLLVLTSSTPEGPIRSESITLRMDNLRPVAKTVEFASSETIQVAELSYAVVPWADAGKDWFEPDVPSKATSPAESLPAGGLAPPVVLSDAQLDLAALTTQLALRELHADTERIDLIPGPRGLQVNGVVESENRKQQIVSRLRTIPNVLPGILTYGELDAKNDGSAQPVAVKMLSVASVQSPLDEYCKPVGISKDSCRLASLDLLTTSTTVARESKRIAKLQQLYPPEKHLTPGAQAILAQLIAGSLQTLTTALSDEESSLRSLGIAAESGVEPPNETASSLSDAAEHNLALIHDIVYATGEQSRSVAAIAPQLMASTANVRSASSRISLPSAGQSNPRSASLPTAR